MQGGFIQGSASTKFKDMYFRQLYQWNVIGIISVFKAWTRFERIGLQLANELGEAVESSMNLYLPVFP